jgi:hypothetical protein
VPLPSRDVDENVCSGHHASSAHRIVHCLLCASAPPPWIGPLAIPFCRHARTGGGEGRRRDGGGGGGGTGPAFPPSCWPASAKVGAGRPAALTCGWLAVAGSLPPQVCPLRPLCTHSRTQSLALKRCSLPPPPGLSPGWWHAWCAKDPETQPGGAPDLPACPLRPPLPERTLLPPPLPPCPRPHARPPAGPHGRARPPPPSLVEVGRRAVRQVHALRAWVHVVSWVQCGRQACPPVARPWPARGPPVARP